MSQKCQKQTCWQSDLGNASRQAGLMARSLMTFLYVMLKLAYHLSYCLLHLHIHFDNHTQRRSKASDYLRELVVGRSTQATMRTVCVSIASIWPPVINTVSRFSGSMTVIGGF